MTKIVASHPAVSGHRILGRLCVAVIAHHATRPRDIKFDTLPTKQQVPALPDRGRGRYRNDRRLESRRAGPATCAGTSKRCPREQSLHLAGAVEPGKGDDRVGSASATRPLMLGLKAARNGLI